MKTAATYYILYPFRCEDSRPLPALSVFFFFFFGEMSPIPSQRTYYIHIYYIYRDVTLSLPPFRKRITGKTRTKEFCYRARGGGGRNFTNMTVWWVRSEGRGNSPFAPTLCHRNVRLYKSSKVVASNIVCIVKITSSVLHEYFINSDPPMEGFCPKPDAGPYDFYDEFTTRGLNNMCSETGFRIRIRCFCQDPNLVFIFLWIRIRFQYPDPGSRIRIQILDTKVCRKYSKCYF